MENQNTSQEGVTKNRSLAIINWVVGALLALTGFVSLFSDFIPGLFLLLAALVILKPTRQFVMSKIRVPVSRPIKIGIMILFLVIAGATMDTKPRQDVSSNNSAGQAQKSENTQTAVTPIEQVAAKPKTLEERITNTIDTSLGSQTNTKKLRVVEVILDPYKPSMLTEYGYKGGESVTGVLIKINSDENLTTNLQKGTMHNEAAKIAQAIFPLNSTIGDIIIWSQLPVKDQYGNVKDGTAIVYSIARPLFTKINWSNFNHRDLPTLLKSESRIDDRNNYYEAINF
ncbi:MAG: hypothetical protein COV34_03190 [Candidatus Zambryskibacteria bacterium CG10_big_fil_rev_8_21_14_0_10_42_12]|uniref:Uncharacterized protein n=1 Tax=Candidatus Zambryskibacteria bacterium CG10_big_fil_rev_8_21_14_0_10_42_12 TaxID=1975115 RepID=A0A2H0QTC4_9BACT|nr:MAG: hypothetical protein COV34_03190 [Candidatus Zambryskibacteria bacterium CG10_big_fil_rev_8_21_14_0_10_42_12]